VETSIKAHRVVAVGRVVSKSVSLERFKKRDLSTLLILHLEKKYQALFQVLISDENQFQLDNRLG